MSFETAYNLSKPQMNKKSAQHPEKGGHTWK